MAAKNDIVSVAVDNAPNSESEYAQIYSTQKSPAVLVQDLRHAMGRISETKLNSAAAYSESMLLLKDIFRFPFETDVNNCTTWLLGVATWSDFSGTVCGRKFTKGSAMTREEAETWVLQTKQYSFDRHGNRSGGQFWKEFGRSGAANIRFYFRGSGEISDRLGRHEAAVAAVDAKYSDHTWTAPRPRRVRC